jgi:hypothetical protein
LIQKRPATSCQEAPRASRWKLSWTPHPRPRAQTRLAGAIMLRPRFPWVLSVRAPVLRPRWAPCVTPCSQYRNMLVCGPGPASSASWASFLSIWSVDRSALQRINKTVVTPSAVENPVY